MVGFESKWEFIAQLNNQLSKDVDLKRVGEIVEELGAELVKTRREVSMRGARGAADWYGFETELWKISEALRSFYRMNRNLRGVNPLSDALARLAQDVNLGKGRQNLVIMLGEFGRGEYQSVLGRLLCDSEVYGHAIKALNRGRVKGYHEQIAKILESEKRGWIKAAARKYLSFSASVERG